MRFHGFVSRFAVLASCGVMMLAGCADQNQQASGKKPEPAADKKTDDKKPEAKKPEESKPAEKQPDPVKTPAEATPAADPGKKPESTTPEVKPADPTMPAETPEAKPAEDKPAEGEKPATPAPGDTAKLPPADTPSTPAPADTPKEETPAAPPKIDVEAQMRLILDMVNRPRAVRKTPDFVAQFIVMADEIIASDASAGYKSTALLSKFKVLHEAAVDGNAGAQEMLFKLADAQRDNTGKRAQEFVRFVDAEKKLLDAKTLEAASLPKLLEDTKTYLKDEELSNRHLRMAQLATEAVERLPESDRDAWYKSLGEQFERSVDGDLAFVGKRFGKPPVPPSALLGKQFELAGTLTSGQALKWENYREKIVLVDFWATWCTFCVDQEPRLKEVHAKYAGRGLEMVGVSIDTNKEDLTRYLREHEIPWITLFGKEPQEVASKYGVRGVPTLFLLDAEGKILMRSNSIAELEPHIKTHVEALEKKLAEKDKK
jgi:thiol-disulfide isomerase/thioredoxin